MKYMAFETIRGGYKTDPMNGLVASGDDIEEIKSDIMDNIAEGWHDFGIQTTRIYDVSGDKPKEIYAIVAVYNDANEIREIAEGWNEIDATYKLSDRCAAYRPTEPYMRV